MSRDVPPETPITTNPPASAGGTDFVNLLLNSPNRLQPPVTTGTESLPNLGVGAGARTGDNRLAMAGQGQDFVFYTPGDGTPPPAAPSPEVARLNDVLRLSNTMLDQFSGVRDLTITPVQGVSPTGRQIAGLHFDLSRDQGTFDPFVVRQGPIRSPGVYTAENMGANIFPNDNGGLSVNGLTGAASNLEGVRRFVARRFQGTATPYAMEIATNGDITGRSTYQGNVRLAPRIGRRDRPGLINVSGESEPITRNDTDMSRMIRDNPGVLDVVRQYIPQIERFNIHRREDGRFDVSLTRPEAQAREPLRIPIPMGDQNVQLELGRNVSFQIGRGADGQGFTVTGISGVSVLHPMAGSRPVELKSLSLGTTAQGQPRMEVEVVNPLAALSRDIPQTIRLTFPRNTGGGR